MGSLGMPEILMILVIALIIFGPRKLPELGKTLGQSLAQFRRASEDFKRQWEDEVVMERQRIDSPAPEPVEHESYSASSVPASSEGEEITSASANEGDGITSASALEEPSQVPTASDELWQSAKPESPVAAHHEETAAKETKHDWM